MKYLTAIIFIYFLISCQSNTYKNDDKAVKSKITNGDSLFLSSFVTCTTLENGDDYFIVQNEQHKRISLVVHMSILKDSIVSSAAIIKLKGERDKFFCQEIFVKNPLTDDSTKYVSSKQYSSKVKDSTLISKLIDLFDKGNKTCDFLEGCNFIIIQNKNKNIKKKYFDLLENKKIIKSLIKDKILIEKHTSFFEN
jgi:hypothetical protein